MNIIFKQAKRSFRSVLQWWRHLSKRTQLSLSLFELAIVFFVLPNIHGGLKILGFVEKDFIVSTSGALYETNNNPYFRALIGSSSDTKQSILKFEIQGKTVTIGLLDAAEEAPVVKLVDVNETPSNLIIPESLIHAEAELASAEAVLQEIANKTYEVSQEVSEIIGEAEQTFFGPREQIVLRAIEKINKVTYYRKQNALIETIELVNPDIETLHFVVKSPDISVRKTRLQDWNLVSEGNGLMTVKTHMVDGRGAVSALPEVDNAFTESTDDTIHHLLLPVEWMQSPSRVFPLKVVRTFAPLEPVHDSLESKLQNIVGEQFVELSLFTSHNPRFLTLFKGDVLYWEALSGTISLIQNGNTIPLFTEPLLSGLSCTDNGCFAARTDTIQFFNPTDILNRLPESDINTFFESLKVSDTPLGGIAVGKGTILRTSYSSPTGAVYGSSTFGGVENKVYENVSFPSFPAVSEDGQYRSFWAEGKLFIGEANSNWQTISIPFEPESVSIGNDNRVYFIVKFDPLQTDMVVRVTPGLGLEILSHVTGDFSSLHITNDTLYLGLNIDERNGAVLKLPQNILAWNQWNEYE